MWVPGVPHPRARGQPPRGEVQRPRASTCAYPACLPSQLCFTLAVRRPCPPRFPQPDGRVGCSHKPRKGRTSQLSGMRGRGGQAGRGQQLSPEPKMQGLDRGRTYIRAAPPPHDHWPLPAQDEDVAGVRGALGLGPALGAAPQGPGLRWGRGHLLHSGPEPRAPHARVLLLCGSSRPGGLGTGPRRAPAVGAGRKAGQCL